MDAPAEAGPDGQIYGWEYLAYDRRGRGRDVTMMVQIPDFFGEDGRPPCIVTGPSSGSRGVYGAIGTSGEWGLKKGCAVAYTDKGTGIGAHDLQAGTVDDAAGRARSRWRRRAELQLHRQGAGAASWTGSSRELPEPLGLEARALARQPRGRLGRVRPALDRVRVLRR